MAFGLLLTEMTLLLSVFLPCDSIFIVREETREEATEHEPEGCFHTFDSSTKIVLGDKNSNYECQLQCKERGYVLAATTNGTDCHCGNNYPKFQVGDRVCHVPCEGWDAKCQGLRECCGGRKSFTVSVVGNIDVKRLMLKRLAKRWRESTVFQNLALGLIEEVPYPALRMVYLVKDRTCLAASKYNKVTEFENADRCFRDDDHMFILQPYGEGVRIRSLHGLCVVETEFGAPLELGSCDMDLAVWKIQKTEQSYVLTSPLGEEEQLKHSSILPEIKLRRRTDVKQATNVKKSKLQRYPRSVKRLSSAMKRQKKSFIGDTAKVLWGELDKLSKSKKEEEKGKDSCVNGTIEHGECIQKDQNANNEAVPEKSLSDWKKNSSSETPIVEINDSKEAVPLVPSEKPDNAPEIKQEFSQTDARLPNFGSIVLNLIDDDDPISWRDDVEIHIRFANLNRSVVDCKIHAKDESNNADTLECVDTDLPATFSIKTIGYTREDEKVEDTGKPEPLGIQFKCEAGRFKRKCSKTHQLSLKKGSSLSVGSGFDVGKEPYDDFDLGNIFDVGSFDFERAVSGIFSMSPGSLYLPPYVGGVLSDSISIEFDLDRYQSAIAEFRREKKSVVYKWKGYFEAMGPFLVKWRSGISRTYGVTKLLRGADRLLYSIGTYKYPLVDTVVVQVDGDEILKRTKVENSSKNVNVIAKDTKKNIIQKIG